MNKQEDEIVLVKPGPVTEVTINRPRQFNSLTPAVLKELLRVFEKLEQDTTVRVVTVWGAGRAFVAGADIPTMVELDPKGMQDYLESGQAVMRAIETSRVPVIAGVQGYALGGGLELALACDIIVASKKAKVGQPEVNLGIIPGFGGTQRLVQRCGVGTARRLIYTGAMISGEEALQLGIIDLLTEPDELQAKVNGIAETISKKAPLAISKAKEAIRAYGDATLCAGLEVEVSTFTDLFESADRKEGMQAFLEKREPQFTGK